MRNNAGKRSGSTAAAQTICALHSACRTLTPRRGFSLGSSRPHTGPAFRRPRPPFSTVTGWRTARPVPTVTPRLRLSASPGFPSRDPARSACESPRSRYSRPARPLQARTRTRITRPTCPSATAVMRPANLPKPIVDVPERYLMAGSCERAGAATTWTSPTLRASPTPLSAGQPVSA